MRLVGGEFEQKLQYYANTWLPARSIVEEAVNTRLQVLGEIMPSTISMQSTESVLYEIYIYIYIFFRFMQAGK